MIDLRPILVFPGCHVRGGVERVVWETMRHLAPHHPVTVVASQVEAGGVDNVTVRRVPAPPPAGPLTPLLWKRAAAPHVPSGAGSVVVSYGSNCPVGDVVVVQSVHRAWLELGRPVRYGPVEVPNLMRYALPRHQVILALEAAYFRSRGYRRVVAVSENVAADLRRLYDVPSERIVVIPNGYAPEQCSPERSAKLRDQSRSEIGLGAGDVAILLVANEWHRKGLRVLLDAVASISGEPLHVVLVGRMPPDAHAGQIARLGLTARVHYCGATDDVARYYAAADLFVMPTQYEAFGSVVVEALASGLPVITTARAGAAVAVQPGINGLLQDEPLDAVELAGLLRRALEPGTLYRWRQAAAESVSGYEWSAIVAQMRDVLVEVAGTPNSVAARSRCRTGRRAWRPSR
ncbi:MAG: glycosyltransferase family 4 protein [Actinobacteria bacterium]|nr:glycosyltransferase family 4 protein [Actinomycetota bacterium]